MVSVIPKDKYMLITAIEANLNKLTETLTTLEQYDNYDPMLVVLAGQVKGSQASVHNLLAYLLGWSDIVVSWLKNPPVVTSIMSLLPVGYNFTSKSLGQLAQHFYVSYTKLSYEALKQQLQKTYEAIVSLLNTYSNHYLYDQLFYKKYTLGRMVDFNTRCPLANINKRLRAHLKQLKQS